MLEQNVDAKNQNLLKVKDVATILNISRSFAYSLMQSGQLRIVRLGHSVRVRPEDLEQFISENVSK